MQKKRLARCLAVAALLTTAGSSFAAWFKGNLHTHSLWSDGDDYPEMIADWYKQQGYHFLAISDHNIVQQGERWLTLKPPTYLAGQLLERGGGSVLEKYKHRFGLDWIEQREASGTTQVRLKPLNEYRSMIEEPGRFLLIPSEEVTSSWKLAKTATEPEKAVPIHINVTNPAAFIAPVDGDSALDVIQKTVDAVTAQREKTGQPMFPHINHPNFGWGITPEELMQVRGDRFFEVYNGHPGVHNKGDATHVSTDVMWDIILARRLKELYLDVMFAVAVDDAHHYHAIGIGKSNAGRGWVMARAQHLTAESIINAMEAGDFYATTGVVLRDIKREAGRLAVEIASESGVTYMTQFIGTRRNYDASGKDIGIILAEVKGVDAVYALKGDEIYVRAKIISSKPKANGSTHDEFETAWTQPLVNPRILSTVNKSSAPTKRTE